MKLKTVAAAIIAGGLVFSGCSGTVQENGKDVVASITDKNILADDIYASLLDTPTGEDALFNYALQQIIDAYFPIDNDMEEYADDAIENIQASYESNYGDDAESHLESALASSGFENLDDYREYLVQSLQYSAMVKDYVKNNFEEVFEDYYTTASPRKISLIKVAVDDMDNPTTEETEHLNEVKALLKTDKSFEEIAADYSDDNSASSHGNLGIVDSESELYSTYGDAVKEKALALKQGEISDIIKGDDGYYFLKCTCTDKETLKEELKTIDLESPLLAYDSYMIYLAFNTYELTYGDDEIKEMIENYVNDALETREESRGNS